MAIRAGLLCAVIDGGPPPPANGAHASEHHPPGEVDPIALARRIRAELIARVGGEVRASASRVAPTHSLRLSFHEARCALEAVRLQNGAGSEVVASYADLGAFQLLLSLQDDDALLTYCRGVLGPVEAGEGEYGDELLRSLDVFIEHNGHWEKAANALYCHRHTLRYRIRRVEQLTGRDFSTARDRIEFWLALRDEMELFGWGPPQGGREAVAMQRRRERIGVPSEIKLDEYRVALTPAGVRELSARGHEVVVQAGAGEGSALADEDFVAQGARILPDARAVFAEAELVLKVKEPQPGEVSLLREGQTLFTYLHLAAEPSLTRGLQASGATCIAYETVEDARGNLPLLAPMSEVAGKLATQAGAFMLEKPLGGRGILLGGVPGVAAATVLVIGGGVVGMNAAIIAIGMQADVFVFDRSIDRLRELEVAFGGRASTVYSSTLAIEQMLPAADLVIGAVLIHGGRAPHVISASSSA